MKELDIKTIFKKPIIRYLVAGGSSYAIELLAIYGLITAGTSKVAAVAVAFWIGFAVSFILQKLYAFEDRRSSKKRAATQIIMYALLVAVNYSFTLATAYALSPILGIFAARTIALIITTAWNFVVYKKIIFSKRSVNLDSFKPVDTTRLSVFSVIAVTLLLGVTSAYVGHKTANIHAYNHDQVINGYMFESAEEFKSSIFPGAHSQLLKWPIFFATAQAGNSAQAKKIATILTYSAMVFALLLAVYMISGKRLYVTSAVGFIMTHTLLLIPPQPMPGKLLPIGAAMITTRNIEYTIFIAAIMLLSYSISKAWKTKLVIVIAGCLLALLIASDNLFTALSIGLGIAVPIFYGLTTRSRDRFLQTMPLLTSALLGLVLAALLTYAINTLSITTVNTGGSPFPLIQGPSQLMLAAKELVRSVAQNFGAYPLPLHETPRFMLVPYAANAVIMLGALLSTLYVMLRWLRQTPKTTHDHALQSVAWLTLCSMATFVLYSITDHEYNSGGRYVSLIYFSGVLCLTYCLVLLPWRKIPRWALLSSVTLTVSLLPITLLASRWQLNYHYTITERHIGNSINAAAQILKDREVKVFIGDFWFSAPTRLAADNDFDIVTMSTAKCETPNGVLASKSWRQPDARIVKSAVYILKDGAPDAKTFNHGCTLEYLNEKYGKHTSEHFLRGNADEPIELIRIYDYDVRTEISL